MKILKKVMRFLGKVFNAPQKTSKSRRKKSVRPRSKTSAKKRTSKKKIIPLQKTPVIKAAPKSNPPVKSKKISAAPHDPVKKDRVIVSVKPSRKTPGQKVIGEVTLAILPGY